MKRHDVIPVDSRLVIPRDFGRTGTEAQPRARREADERGESAVSAPPPAGGFLVASQDEAPANEQQAFTEAFPWGRRRAAGGPGKRSTRQVIVQGRPAFHAGRDSE